MQDTKGDKLKQKSLENDYPRFDRVTPFLCQQGWDKIVFEWFSNFMTRKLSVKNNLSDQFEVEQNSRKTNGHLKWGKLEDESSWKFLTADQKNWTVRLLETFYMQQLRAWNLGLSMAWKILNNRLSYHIMRLGLLKIICSAQKQCIILW